MEPSPYFSVQLYPSILHRESNIYVHTRVKMRRTSNWARNRPIWLFQLAYRGLLRSIKDRSNPKKDMVMLWAACCVDFSASWEQGSSQSEITLAMTPLATWAMVTWQCTAEKDLRRYGLWSSSPKRIHFWRASISTLAGWDLCLVAALLEYLADRGSKKGLLMR